MGMAGWHAHLPPLEDCPCSRLMFSAKVSGQGRASLPVPKEICDKGEITLQTQPNVRLLPILSSYPSTAY